MRTPSLLRALRPRLLLLGVAGTTALAGCVDSRDPDTTLPIVGPRFDHGTTTLSGLCTITVDGIVDATEWAGAAKHRFELASGGWITLYWCNDAANVHVALVSDKPIAGSNQDVVRIYMEESGASIRDAFGLAFGTYLDEYCTNKGCSSDGTNRIHGAGKRSGSGGRSTYEMSKPLQSGDRRDLDLVAGDFLTVSAQIVPGGKSPETRSGPLAAQIAGGTPAPGPSNDPSKPDATITLLGSPCDYTVFAGRHGSQRTTDPLADNRLQRAVQIADGVCTTKFIDLPPGGIFVFSGEMLSLQLLAHQIVWPNLSADIPVFTTLQTTYGGTVFIHSTAAGSVYSDGSSARKIPANLDQAYANAKALPTVVDASTQNQAIDIALQTGNVRANACSGVPEGTFVHAGVLLDRNVYPNIPPNMGDPNSPASAEYIAATTSDGTTTSCLATSADQAVVVKGYDPATGTVYTGSIPAGSTGTVNLTRDLPFFREYYVTDPEGDETPDYSVLRYGRLKDGNNQATEQFAMVANVARLHQTSKVSKNRFDFIFTDPSGAKRTLQPTVLCNSTGDGSCVLHEVYPTDLAGMVTSPADGYGKVDPSTGIGKVQVVVRLDYFAPSLVDFAELRLGTVDSDVNNGFIPNVGLTFSDYVLNGYALWDRAKDTKPTQSLFVPF